MPALVTPITGGAMSGLVAVTPGWVVEIAAPPGTDTSHLPAGGPVVAWAAIADEAVVGGVRVDPVFVSAGRAWTPDQYRAVYGDQFSVHVARD